MMEVHQFSLLRGTGAWLLLQCLCCGLSDQTPLQLSSVNASGKASTYDQELETYFNGARSDLTKLLQSVIATSTINERRLKSERSFTRTAERLFSSTADILAMLRNFTDGSDAKTNLSVNVSRNSLLQHGNVFEEIALSLANIEERLTATHAMIMNHFDRVRAVINPELGFSHDTSNTYSNKTSTLNPQVHPNSARSNGTGSAMKQCEGSTGVIQHSVSIHNISSYSDVRVPAADGTVLETLFSDVDVRIKQRFHPNVSHPLGVKSNDSLITYTMPEKLSHTDVLLVKIIDSLSLSDKTKGGSCLQESGPHPQTAMKYNRNFSQVPEATMVAYRYAQIAAQYAAPDNLRTIREIQVFSEYFSPAFRGHDSEKLYTGCRDAFAKGQRTAGVFTISVGRGVHFRAWCDFDATTGWAVIQRRVDGLVDFFKRWNEYENGFGNLWGEHWIGLSSIKALAGDGVPLSIYIEDFESRSAWANYSTFKVDDASNYYRLTVSGFTGTAGDSLRYHDGSMFSAWDNDKDESTGSCASVHKGAWWYKSCCLSNLNGRYEKGLTNSFLTSNYWGSFRGERYGLRSSVMRINA